MDDAIDRLEAEGGPWPGLARHRRTLRGGAAEKRALLGDLLISNGAPQSEALLRAVDEVYEAEQRQKEEEQLEQQQQQQQLRKKTLSPH